MFFSVVLSFFDWSGYDRNPFKTFVGIENYVDLVKDPLFWKSLQNTIILVFVVVVVMVAISLFLALVIFYGNFKFDNIIRAMIFFPGVVSQIIIGLVFRRLLAADGLINIVLEGIGLEQFAQSWLGNDRLVMWIVSLVVVWQWVGYIMVIFYAALQNVDQNLVEAASIDGASMTRTITSVVIPLLRPAIYLSMILNFIGGFRVYAIIWILTRGGPVHSSEVLTTYMYYQSFSHWGPNDMSYGAAIAVALTLIVLVFAAIRIRFLSREG
jgi:raffinose/stachyose/melibiose transport system permease protein